MRFQSLKSYNFQGKTNFFPQNSGEIMCTISPTLISLKIFGVPISFNQPTIWRGPGSKCLRSRANHPKDPTNQTHPPKLAWMIWGIGRSCSPKKTSPSSENREGRISGSIWSWIVIQTWSEMGTPRKINMEPENIWLEKENHLSKPSFSGSMLIFGGVAPKTPWPNINIRFNVFFDAWTHFLQRGGDI